MKDKILELLSKASYQPLDVDGIANILGVHTGEEFTLLAKALVELEDEYLITHNKRNCFALLTYFKMLKGIITIKDGGYGFVDGPDFSVYVDERDLRSAVTGDEVIVKYFENQKGTYDGVVERIVKRNTPIIIGPLIKYKGRYFVKSVNYRIRLWVNIKDIGKAKPHQIVKVKITNYYGGGNAEGKIMEVLGYESESGMDITALVLSSGAIIKFAEDTLKEAKAVPQVINKKDYPNRRDLTNKLIITIDGDDAKDLDDAVHVELLPNGNYLLGVYIADVSNYVQENSFLDIEAYERGTSIYLPDRVIPMLPEELSNGICSLNEHVDRLVMACEMEINNKGEVVSQEIFEGIINSCHRMTYNKVNEIIEEHLQATIESYADIYDMLIKMQQLATILNQMRITKGAFEFENNEAKLTLDETGKVIAISLRERRQAEKLIEEFMLIANETVATVMTWLDVPFIYRVHEEPKEERLNQFLVRLKFLEQDFTYKNKASLPKALQQLLLTTNDRKNPEEQALKTIISTTLLRTMAKARYQEINVGHYGLASKCYTHFTSPIRRYPDLLVHRLIKTFLLNENSIANPVDYFTSKVHDTGLQASSREKLAENLERDATDMKKCEYMQSYLGATFTGMISSVVNWGIYVVLDNTVEGLVRFDDMPNDYYDVDDVGGRVIGKRTGATYQMGDVVKVKLNDIDKEKRQISFKLLRKIE